MNFEYLGLAPETLRAVEEAGYKEPTPIQAQAIPIVLQGRDVLGIAQTGTGKTASFTLPMIDVLSQGRTRARMPRSLILEPTRELAAQVAQNFEIYGKYHKLSMALLIGGVSFDDQERKLDRGVDVLIATPGRLLDHFGRGKLMMTGVEILVIDEADRMLDMGFIPDVERICALITKKHQTLFFSATMPREIQGLVSKFLDDPKRIEVAPPASPAANVEQFLLRLPNGEPALKRSRLRDLLRREEVKNAIIFCNRKRDVDVLFRSLKKHGFNAAALHGDMDQGSRMEVLDSFKGGTVQLLIASDVAARGLDIPSMSHVFNFDVPSHAEDYIHRIGRTGRAGRSGRAFMLSTPADSKWLRNVENLIGKPIQPMGGENSAPAPEEDDTLAAPSDGDRRGRRRRRRKGERGAPEGDRAERQQNGTGQAEPAEAKAGQPQGSRTEEPMRNRDHNQRGRSGRGDRRRGGRDDRHRDDDFEPVVGLGDHVPEFLLRDVVIGPATADTSDDDDEPVEQAQAEEPKKPRRSRSRAKKAPAGGGTTASPAGEATAEEQAAAIAEAEAPAEPVDPPAAESAAAEEAVTEAAAVETPKPRAKRARKPRAKKAAAETAAEPPAQAEAAPAQAEAAPAEGDAPAEEKPKPKRRSRAKKATAETAPAEAAAADDQPAEEKTADADQAPKPRAKRTRKPRAKKPAAEET